jgi:hypothetical protein
MPTKPLNLILSGFIFIISSVHLLSLFKYERYNPDGAFGFNLRFFSRFNNALCSDYSEVD